MGIPAADGRWRLVLLAMTRGRMAAAAELGGQNFGSIAAATPRPPHNDGILDELRTAVCSYA